MKYQIKFFAFSIFSLLIAGCGSVELTNLQKADKLFLEDKYQEARGFYILAEDEQRIAAVVPKMNITETKESVTSPDSQEATTRLNIKYDCHYQFNAEDAAKAILGIAKTYRAQDNYDMALYYYSYYIQFCVRQGMDFKSEMEEIKEYLNENNRSSDQKLFNIFNDEDNSK